MAQNLKVKISSDLTGLKSGANRAKSIIKDVGATALAIGGVGAAGGFAVFTKQLIDMGDQLGKTAKRIGVTAEEYQELAFAARRSGASTETVERAFKRMQSTIFDAGRNLASARDALELVGLNFDQLNRKSPAKQFEIIADALNQVTDSTTKAALAQDIFGRAGTDIIPMLSDYKNLAQEIRDIGGVISEENIKAAEDFKDSMENLDISIKAVAANSGLISWLASVADGMSAIVTNSKRIEQVGATGTATTTLGTIRDTAVEIAKSADTWGVFGGLIDKIAGAKGEQLSLPVDEGEAIEKSIERGSKKRKAELAERRRREESANKQMIDDLEKQDQLMFEGMEKQDKKNKDALDSLKNQLKILNLIKEGKREEAEFQDKIFQLKKSGVEVDKEMEELVRQKVLLSKDEDSLKAPSDELTRDTQTDRLLRMGGIIGARGATERMDKERNELLKKIAENTETSNTGVFA